MAAWRPLAGVRVVVQAWTACERLEATLEFIGETDIDPEYAASVRATMADASGASVAVSGPVDDAKLRAAYAAADLFALPFLYEGYGIVHAEALAYGLPGHRLRRRAAIRVGRRRGRTPGDAGRCRGAL